MSEEALVSVLLVEDDERLARFTAEYLEKQGILIELAFDGLQGLAMAKKQHYDAVLLDLMLPHLDGIQLCRQLRQVSNVPILMLTARGEEADRVLGLESGADDYLVKPFSPRELLARVKALVRRARGKVGPANAVVEVGALFLDPSRRFVSLSGQEINLTTYEFTLLRILAERAGQVLSREQILDLAKGSNEESFDRSIDVHISRLRAKLEQDTRQPRWLKTIRGVGYMLARQESSG